MLPDLSVPQLFVRRMRPHRAASARAPVPKPTPAPPGPRCGHLSGDTGEGTRQGNARVVPHHHTPREDVGFAPSTRFPVGDERSLQVAPRQPEVSGLHRPLRIGRARKRGLRAADSAAGSTAPVPPTSHPESGSTFWTR